MERHGLGQREYKCFENTRPPAIAELRNNFYPLGRKSLGRRAKARAFIPIDPSRVYKKLS